MLLRNFSNVLILFLNCAKLQSEMDLAADFEVKSPSEITQDQAEVVLVGCGAPNRGMGWYHAVQMLEGR